MALLAENNVTKLKFNFMCFLFVNASKIMRIKKQEDCKFITLLKRVDKSER
jgi:hypothetical protein